MSGIRWVIVASCVALVAAGCGRSDDSGSGNDDPSPSSTAAAVATGDGIGFGSLTNVCQPGDATGATAQGVTDGDITIGTFSDPGFAGRPGLNQELFDTAEVFSQWCNDAGGINGRKIVVNEHDAALTNYRPQMLEACAEDFVMVGGGAVFDDTGVEDRLQCMLPDIAGFVVTPKARGSELLVQALPNPITTTAIGDYRWLGEKFPSTTKHVGILTGNLPTTVTVAKQAREVVESLGWKVVYDDQYPAAGPTSWATYVQSMKADGVEGLVWVGEPENLAKLELGMADANFRLEWVRADPNHYDRRLIDLAGPTVDNTYITSTISPFEDAGDVPATQQYLDAFAEYKPDAKTKAYLGVQAWSAWLLFAQAARDCGSDLTRRCVYDNAKKVHEWTGGGLHAPTDPGENNGSACFVLLRATTDGFVTPDIDPTDGVFRCSPKNAYVYENDYGKGVTLADVGKTIDDLE